MKNFHIKTPSEWPRKRREILFWQAWFGNTLIDQNNSLPILRNKWKGQNLIFKSVR